MSPHRVVLAYIRSWFSLDIALIVLNWTSVMLGRRSFTSSPGFPDDHFSMEPTVIAIRAMRFLLLLRFMKVAKAFLERMHMIGSDYILALLNLCKLIVILIVFGHYVACGWFALTIDMETGSRAQGTWLDAQDADRITAVGYAYFTSLHWALTQFTPASMEVVPRNRTERIYNVFVILIAMVVFSSFVSSITSTMTHIASINATRRKQEALFRRFFHQYKIPSPLANSAWSVLRRSRVLSDGRLKMADVDLLKMLPGHMIDDIKIAAYTPLLSEHSLFEHLCSKVGADPHLKRDLICEALTEKTVIMKDILFSSESPVPAMIFVVKGKLFYYDYLHQKEEVIHEGGWACEAALWADKAMLNGPLVAEAGRCEVLLIDAKIFRSVAQQSKSFPKMVKYAQLFIRSFNKECCNPDAESCLFNDPIRLCSMLQGSLFKTFKTKASIKSATSGQ